MIDLNYLNDFPKSLIKESSIFKYLLNIYNELKSESLYIKSIVEIENKSIESITKSTLINIKNFTNDSVSIINEDITNSFKIIQTFIQGLESFFNEVNNNSNNTIIHFNKAFNDLSDDINEILKGNNDNIALTLKDLNKAREKFKSACLKAEKLYKELEANCISKKKLENDAQNSYNLSMKDKIEDKILNILNDFEDNKAAINLAYDDCGRLEGALNELIKTNFVNVVKFLNGALFKLTTSFENLTAEKAKMYEKIKDEILISNYEQIDKIEFCLDNQETRLIDTRFINKTMDSSGLNYPTTNFGFIINLLNQNDSTFLDDNFNKNNFYNSTLTDNLLSYINSLLQTIANRKKQLQIFVKLLNDIIRNYETYNSLANKLIKNLSQPKLITLANCSYLIQLGEFLRSLFELIIKKFEDYSKLIFNNLITPIEYSVLKDINTDELFFSQILTKIQKEYNNFKTNINKINQSKEKVIQNILKIKENIQKTSDDPNNFSKYEKQFLNPEN